MTQDKCVLLDYEDSIEILFSMPPGSKLNYPNEVVDYIRSRDNKTVSWVSSAGMREVQFEMVTSSSPTLERQLNYFRKSGKPVLLFIPDIYFASEIVIREADLTETIGTTQTYSVSAYCYGVEGMAMIANDPSGFWVTATTADADSISENVITLSGATEYIEIHATPVDEINIAVGNYTAYVRAKSSAGSANDMKLGMYDHPSGYIATDTVTVASSGYLWYAVNATVTASASGHVVNTFAQKDTSATNLLYIDMIAFVQASGLITV